MMACFYETRFSCGPVAAVGAARENIESAGDGPQRTLVGRRGSAPCGLRLQRGVRCEKSVVVAKLSDE